MLCVETIDYFVLVNGSSLGSIVSGRGLRRSDPLSPYLFIICVEGLSSLVHEAKCRNDIRGAIVSCLKIPIVIHVGHIYGSSLI